MTIHKTCYRNFHTILVSNKDAYQRLVKMGEKNQRYIVGCPSIEALFNEKLISKNFKKFGIDFDKKFIIVVQH